MTLIYSKCIIRKLTLFVLIGLFFFFFQKQLEDLDISSGEELLMYLQQINNLPKDSHFFLKWLKHQGSTQETIDKLIEQGFVSFRLLSLLQTEDIIAMDFHPNAQRRLVYHLSITARSIQYGVL